MGAKPARAGHRAAATGLDALAVRAGSSEAGEGARRPALARPRAEEVRVQKLEVALGLTDIAAVYGDGGRVAAIILDRNAAFGLSGGLWTKRARVMDRNRIEIVGGAAQRAALTSDERDGDAARSAGRA